VRGLPPHSLFGKARVLKVTAWIDGAARGNPGPAGYGVYMTKDREVIEVSGFLGNTTNNVAEYAGLINALVLAASEGAREVEIISDSELLVKQMLGQYRVKHPNMVPLYEKAQDLLTHFDSHKFQHNLRDKNELADKLANKAMNTRADVTDID